MLLNLINELEKEIKCEACRTFYHCFATSLINSIIQEDKFILDSFYMYHMPLNHFDVAFMVLKC